MKMFDEHEIILKNQEVVFHTIRKHYGDGGEGYRPPVRTAEGCESHMRWVGKSLSRTNDRRIPQEMKLDVLKAPKYLESEIEALEEEIFWARKYLQDEDSIAKMQDRIVQLRTESEAIQKKIIDNIDDPEILEAIRLYQNGRTWENINIKIYGYSGQSFRKRVERYLAKIDFT